MLIINSIINRWFGKMTKKQSEIDYKIECMSRKFAKEEIDNSPIIQTLIKSYNSLTDTLKDINGRVWFLGGSILFTLIADVIIHLIKGS